jgi:hypothetical protein
MISTTIGNYHNPGSIGSKLRRRRSRPLSEIIERTYERKGCCSILDLGGTETYWNIFEDGFLRDRRCEIVLLNRTSQASSRPGLFRSVAGDACAVEAENDTFDIVHSNSVIEHVGDWSRARAFSAEVRRLAPSYFVQTPNFWFPWEPHFGFLFFQCLPFPLRVSLLMRRKQGFFKRCETLDAAIESVESARLLTGRMMRSLFPDARIVRERFLGLTKSFIAVRERTTTPR